MARVKNVIMYLNIEGYMQKCLCHVDYLCTTSIHFYSFAIDLFCLRQTVYLDTCIAICTPYFQH